MAYKSVRVFQVEEEPACTGFEWQGFGSEGGTTGLHSVRSCWKLPLCPIEPVPAISKTNLLLAKAEPISDGGTTSVTTYLQRKKKQPCIMAFSSRR